MRGVSASGRSVTFSSLAASFSSDAASHCCRPPFSYQTARQRPCSSRPGYTVIPYSGSITGPPPRVAARPVPLARTMPRATRPAFARPAGRAAPPRTGCGTPGWYSRKPSSSPPVVQLAAAVSRLPSASLTRFGYAEPGPGTRSPRTWHPRGR